MSSPSPARLGGEFSSGDLRVFPLAGNDKPQVWSNTDQSQLGLIPFFPQGLGPAKLPTDARIGDFFMFMKNDPRGAQLWICTDWNDVTNLPLWQRVQMEPTKLEGGSVAP
jgi:hypothetical protein